MSFTSLTAALLLAAQVQAAGSSGSDSAQPERIVRPNMSRASVFMHIPDDITPAVLPYVRCVIEASNRRAVANMSGDEDSSDGRLSKADILRSCEADRRAAIARADGLPARRAGEDSQDRRARVETSMREFERTWLELPEPDRSSADNAGNH
jgi:hypothetical protein